MDARKDKTKIVGGISLVAGLWLAAYALLAGLGFASNAFIVGALIVVLSLIELASMESVTWVSWANGILGLWLLISPAFFADMAARDFWNSVISGIVVLGLAVWGGMSSRMGMGHPKMG